VAGSRLGFTEFEDAVCRVEEMEERKNQKERAGGRSDEVGSGLLSHTVTSAVPSALVGLTTGFGMGPGVPPPL
jgi:hypothetical protein